MTVFDADGSKKIESYEDMCAVMKELNEDTPGKWRGNVKILEDSAEPAYALEMNQMNQPPAGAPIGFTALSTDHVIKLGFGVVIKMTDSEYADRLGQQS